MKSRIGGESFTKDCDGVQGVLRMGCDVFFLARSFWSAEVEGDVPKPFESKSPNSIIAPLVGGYS